MRRKLKRPSPSLVIALTALVAALSGTAIAAIPGPNGYINSCYSNSSGALRVIDTGKGQKCQSSETRLYWKQDVGVGPTGPTGPAGPTGDTGSKEQAGGTQWHAFESNRDFSQLGSTPEKSYSAPLDSDLAITVPPGDVLTGFVLTADVSVTGRPDCNYSSPQATLEWRFTDGGSRDWGWSQLAGVGISQTDSPDPVTETNTGERNLTVMYPSGTYTIQFRLVASGGQTAVPAGQAPNGTDLSTFEDCGEATASSDHRRVWFEVAHAPSIQDVDA